MDEHPRRGQADRGPGVFSVQKFLSGILALFVLAGRIDSAAFADQPAPRTPYIVAGDGGRYDFKMVPSFEHGKPDRGQAYEVVGEGPDRPIWSVSGWYSHGTYLSYDGEYLVRLGTWSFAGTPSAEDLGVAFYKRGQLLKGHSIKDLVLDPGKAPRTVSFAHYLDGVGGFEPDLLSSRSPPATGSGTPST